MSRAYLGRKGPRLRGFDYSENRAYFVTVCTHERREILAHVRGGEALLCPAGVIVEEEIQNLEKRYPVCLDRYIVMPNHIHMILTLRNNEGSDSWGLSDLLCTLKSITTKRINRAEGHKGTKIWQRSFHDHIIRDENDYLRIWRYIENNPAQREQDCFFDDRRQEEQR